MPDPSGVGTFGPRPLTTGDARILPPLDAPLDDRRQELASDIAGMADEVAAVDPRAEARLNDLAAALASDDGTQRWSDVDMRRAFNTERLAHAWAVRHEGGYASGAIALADRVRNVLVLVPILLTWFALAEASRAYASFIAKNPDDVRKPFLLLWETGFGGEIGPLAPTFSRVALFDAVLIGLIIVLTFYAHGRREARDDKIDEAAGGYQTDLDNVLAEASIVLAGDRGSRPALLARSVERLAERFDRSSQELLTRLRLEHDRLEQIASRREREFSDFGVFASGMRAGAEETHRLLVELRQVSTGLQSALEDLTSEVSVSTDQGRTLLVAIQGLERLTTSGIQSDQAVTRQFSAAATTLAEAADKAVGGADAAAQAARLATETTRSIVDMTQSLAGSQARIEAAVTAETASNTRLADALRGSANGVATSTRALAEIVASLTQLRDDLGRIAANSANQASALSALLDEQTNIAGGMAEVGRDLSSISIVTGQRHETLAKEIGGLVARLDSLASALGRAATATPNVETLERAFAAALRTELAGQADQIADAIAGGGNAAKRDPGRLWPQRRS
ncbi:MAG TPA: hypothetical protein VFI22_07190 [Thermomicrobiales bacterium]|nr:hypothetical protein [Thermomicrobiales bacterium]